LRIAPAQNTAQLGRRACHRSSFSSAICCCSGLNVAYNVFAASPTVGNGHVVTAVEVAHNDGPCMAAGSGVRQRSAALRMPRWSPPPTLWMVIGAAYCLVCSMELTRLLALPSSSQVTTAAALLLNVMLVNAY
jgi:hypothetical protein